jgi:hypothetical protein
MQPADGQRKRPEDGSYLPNAPTIEERAMSSGWKVFAIVLSLCLMQGGGAHAETGSTDGYRLSDPAIHGNLAIYFVHGKSRDGPVPLTLQEALAKKVVDIREIGHVNELIVENVGAEEVFIQAGDIVKGGQQDRVLSVSLVITPHSGTVTIPSFCVEAGRWSARAGEDVRTFSSANSALPSREAKIEMAGPVTARPDSVPSAVVGTRQQEIWRSVAQIQSKLTNNLDAAVAAPRSHTSLQLTLENGRLEQELADYVDALRPLGEKEDDIVGYVFAINGKLNSADIYPSNGLFRKMWPKLLRASATEAIGERDAGDVPAPSASSANEFIHGETSTRSIETRAGDKVRVQIKENVKVMSLESRPKAAPPDGWVHRSYLAK